MAGTEIDQDTPNRNYPLPTRTNNLDFDVARLREALAAVDGDIAAILAAVAVLAPLANPIFTGEPKAPTPAQGDGSARLATTAYVDQAVGGADLSGFAKLDSPNFSGSPTAPTPTEGKNDSTIAPTAYVDRAIAALKGTVPDELNTLQEIVAQLLLRQKISDVNNNAGFKNDIINGDFDFWNRLPGGTTGTWVSPISNYYAADRWVAQSNGTGGQGAISRQAFTPGQTDVPGDPAWFLRWQITSAAFGQTAGSCFIEQRMENVRRHAGKKRTVTIYAKGVGKISSINLVQVFGSGGSLLVLVPLKTDIDLTGSWQKIQAVVDVPSIAGKTLGSSHYTALNIQPAINTTFTLDLAHVSFTRGDTSGQDDPSPAIDYAVEKERCQRFYIRKAIAPDYTNGAAANTIYRGGSLPVGMRRTPDVSIVSGPANGYSPTGAPVSLSSFAITMASELDYWVTATGSSISGWSQGAVANFDAEL